MTANVDPRGQSTLGLLYPPFAQMCATAADALAANGTWICFFNGLRTAAEQNRDYEQGRTSPGHIITNARGTPAQSMHQYGLAVDAVPYMRGRAGALNWNVDTPQYQAFVQAMRDAGCDWGGAWVSLKDNDHFQIPGLGASPSAAMQAEYGTGSPANLQAIWARIKAGG
jgi:hypothetical protein